MQGHLRQRLLDLRQAAGRALLRRLAPKVVPPAAPHRPEQRLEPLRGTAIF